MSSRYNTWYTSFYTPRSFESQDTLLFPRNSSLWLSDLLLINKCRGEGLMCHLITDIIPYLSKQLKFGKKYTSISGFSTCLFSWQSWILWLPRSLFFFMLFFFNSAIYSNLLAWIQKMQPRCQCTGGIKVDFGKYLVGESIVSLFFVKRNL